MPTANHPSGPTLPEKGKTSQMSRQISQRPRILFKRYPPLLIPAVLFTLTHWGLYYFRGSGGLNLLWVLVRGLYYFSGGSVFWSVMRGFICTICDFYERDIFSS